MITRLFKPTQVIKYTCPECTTTHSVTAWHKETALAHGAYNRMPNVRDSRYRCPHCKQDTRGNRLIKVVYDLEGHIIESASSTRHFNIAAEE